DVYIHGTVRDSSGTKMSKSLGNVIDPLDVIKEVGSDALRFSIISITSQGQDVFLSKEKFEIGRNFANKLWNASRYVLMNVASPVPEGDIDAKELTLADRWILDQFDRTIAEADKSLTAYRFNDAAGVLYDFIWHKYCDWYLEISKSSENTETVHKVLIKVLKGSLQLLHPIMPFITEEIWQSLPGANEKWIMTSVWPRTDKRFRNKKASSDMDKLVEVITSVRNIRAFWNIAHTANVNISLEIRDDEDKRLLNENSGYVEKLGKCRIRDAQSAGADLKTRRVEKLAGGIKVSVYLEESMIDVEREKERVSKKMKEIDKYLTSLTGKLKNKKFIENAPKDVVEKERGKQKKWEEERDFLGKNLDALK
ncbi:MAG: class I tRNA ligase family protein, partial [Candidatus Omnitrophica bacterium]|nr:class I tRNA ligase family protein [Candidatus Omnitrophota bacterium]